MSAKVPKTAVLAGQIVTSEDAIREIKKSVDAMRKDPHVLVRQNATPPIVLVGWTIGSEVDVIKILADARDALSAEVRWRERDLRRARKKQ